MARRDGSPVAATGRCALEPQSSEPSGALGLRGGIPAASMRDEMPDWMTVALVLIAILVALILVGTLQQRGRLSSS
jgi:hypothetical protein